MKESNLWNNLRKKLSEVLWQRIETGGTGRGIADVFGVYSSNCCWVELKVTNTNAVKLRPEQIAWLIKFGEAGVPTYILVGTDKRKLHLFLGHLLQLLLIVVPTRLNYVCGIKTYNTIQYRRIHISRYRF